jgi:signal transduction histidine kinase/DNA-binding NarL/FixJ family response regulator
MRDRALAALGTGRAALACRFAAWLVVALGVAVLPAAASTAPPIEVTDATTLPLQVERMDLLRDPTRRLDLAQVRRPDIAAAFAPAAAGIPNLGVGRDAVWARFAVHNASGQPLPLLLALNDPRTAQVAFWALDGAGRVISARRDGRFAHPAERDRSHRWFLFDLPLATDATATVYLRVTSDMGRRLDLRLTDRLRLATADRTAYGWLGLFFGALLFMLAYNLLLLVQLRDASYFWLCTLIAGVGLWMADREGLLTTLTWRLWPEAWSGNQAGVALGLIGVFMFPVSFLRLREHAPRLRRMHIALAAAMACVPFLYRVSPATGYGLSQALALLGGTAMLVSAALALRWQRRAAFQYLLAWSPLLIAILLVALTNYALTPSLSSVWVLTYASVLLMLLLLSVAQADRVNALRRRAERAQAALAQNEQRLTELVAERTRELAVQRDRAEAASRAKTRFLANMSHDLRTPLNAVLGGADLLSRSPRLDTEAQGHCGLIQRGGRHLLRLIEDLLDIARIEHDRLRPVLADLELKPMLEDLAAVTRRAAEARGLGFRAEFADDLPRRVRTDGRRLRQVLQNLLDNAVKYTDAGGVGLSAAPDPAAGPADDAAAVLVFTVSDTGRGIAQADQERLFAPFEQYDHSRDGSGLGLAICRELAGVLGGELSLASAPGHGSRFRFRLPVQVPATAVAEGDCGLAPIVGYAGPRRRVLVIDDSETNLLLMAGLLGHLGFDADTAEGADAALAIARRRPPDLAIVDLQMPGTCGYAASWQLRTALGRPSLPVIAASASPLPAAGDAALLGFNAFVLKPIEQGALCAAIADCLGLRWLRAAAERDDSPRGVPAPMPTTVPPPAPPPRIELDTAAELAMLGDWAALRDWSTELDDAFPECAEFARRMRGLLDDIDAGGDAATGAEAALHQLLAGRG